jgi:hypothetical protein
MLESLHIFAVFCVFSCFLENIFLRSFGFVFVSACPRQTEEAAAKRQPHFIGFSIFPDVQLLRQALGFDQAFPQRAKGLLRLCDGPEENQIFLG